MAARQRSGRREALRRARVKYEEREGRDGGEKPANSGCHHQKGDAACDRKYGGNGGAGITHSGHRQCPGKRQAARGERGLVVEGVRTKHEHAIHHVGRLPEPDHVVGSARESVNEVDDDDCSDYDVGEEVRARDIAMIE